MWKERTTLKLRRFEAGIPTPVLRDPDLADLKSRIRIRTKIVRIGNTGSDIGNSPIIALCLSTWEDAQKPFSARRWSLQLEEQWITFLVSGIDQIHAGNCQPNKNIISQWRTACEDSPGNWQPNRNIISQWPTAYQYSPGNWQPNRNIISQWPTSYQYSPGNWQHRYVAAGWWFWN
jgi:hypothetical protein